MTENDLDSVAQKSWWVVLLQGIITILFGVGALAWPGLTLFTLLLLFGIFAILVGVARIVTALVNRDESGWWLVLTVGIASVAMGIFVFIWPGLTGLLLLYVIGVQAILFGVSTLWRMVTHWRTAEDKWLALLSGPASIAFGVLVFGWPGASALTLAWLIGIYAVVFGVSEIVSSFLIRRAAT